MRVRDWIEWVLLAAIWGASFLFTRAAVPEFGPFPLVGVRLAVAAAVLAVPGLVGGGWGHARRHWPALLALGAVNSAVPFTLFAWAMQWLSAGDASVLNATAPLFAAGIGGLVFRERMSVRRGVGLGVGFGGVVLLVWEKLSFAGSLWAVAAGLAAGLLYGVSSHLVARYLKGVPSVTVSGVGLLFAAALQLPVAAFNLPPAVPSATSWLAAAALGVICSAVAYLMYFRLMKNVGPVRAMTVAYLIPVFGILWGCVLLSEPVSAFTVAGGAVIVAGTLLVQLPERKREVVPPE